MKKILSLTTISLLALAIVSACNSNLNEEQFADLQNQASTASILSTEFSTEAELDEAIIDTDYYKNFPDATLANNFISQIQSGVLPTQEYKTTTDEVKAQSFLSIFNKKAIIDVYEPYGTPNKVNIVGRVYKKRSITAPTANDSKFKNIIRNIKYFVPDPISNIDVNVNVAGSTKIVKTDNKGYFQLSFNSPPVKLGVNNIVANLVTTKYKADDAKEDLVVDSQTSDKVSVISDIDDTVKYTGVNHTLEMIKNTLIGNFKTDKPYAGVASLYKGIINGSQGTGFECMHYVSGGPTMLYPRLHEFFRYNRFPNGSLDLKYSDDKLEKKMPDIFQYKLSRIRNIMNAYPNKKFVCFGDTTQKDTEVYSELKKEFPNRIVGIYINNVNKFNVTDPRFKDVKLTNTALDAAKDLQEQGVISQDTVDIVASEVSR